MEWAQNAALYSLRGWRRTLCRNGYVRMSDNYQARPNSCLLFRQNKEGNDKRPITQDRLKSRVLAVSLLLYGVVKIELGTRILRCG